jgi:diguanylate cyclase (GGDEF)-like protein
VRDTIHLSGRKHGGWKAGDFSLQLLLGLRDASVDARLRELVSRLDGGATNDEIGPAALTEALADGSIHRLVRLVSRTASALPLAWSSTTVEELRVLVWELPQALRHQRPSLGVPPVVFASLCEFARRHGDATALGFLERLGAERWLERVELAMSSRQPLPNPKHADATRPAWLPELPPPLIRDPLTGLLNRSVLTDDPHRFRLPDGSRISTLPSPRAFLLDVDRMKQILDIYGMRSGDGVLIAIAEHLQSLFGDRVVRFGGDEFLVVWDGKDVATAARIAVESTRALSVMTFEEPKQPIAVTVSAGVGTGTEPVAVLHRAQDALARAKVNGRNRVEE